MNKWKVAFFALVTLILIIIIGTFLWATTPTEEMSFSQNQNIQNDSDTVLQVELTSNDFEKVINKLLTKEFNAFQLKISTNVELLSELQVFGVAVPISMYFDPIVQENGNIELKQTEVNVGKLNLPPETVLKIMKDSLEFPNWITIRPETNVIDIDLSKVEIMDGAKVRAKEINLEQDRVVLEVVLTDD